MENAADPLFADLGLVVPPRPVAEPHRRLGLVPVEHGWVRRLRHDIAGFCAPRLELVEEVLLTRLPQVSDRDLDLDSGRTLALVEVEVVCEGQPSHVGYKDPPESRYDTPRRAARGAQIPLNCGGRFSINARWPSR